MPRLSKIGAAALGAFGWTGLSSVTATYLVVAGGGGGGSNVGGGGGAGGYRTGTATLNPLLSYTVVVGAGGGGFAPPLSGASGGDSTFNNITSTGGGGGGYYSNTGSPGGSGGGGGSFNGTPIRAGGAGNTPSTSPSQGNNGGSGDNGSGGNGAGGGGGASAVGASVVSGTGTGGAGGAGTASSISGTSTYYAGGGGGGSANGSAAGGAGGGGTGATYPSTFPTTGTANTGGGGGGGTPSGTGTTTYGANGGSGVVIISYLGAQQFGGGVVTSVGGYTIHTFTTSGTLSPLSLLSASYLVVAGGGGGGAGHAGGGGAGGLLTGTGVTIDTNSNYVVTVGAGGAGGVNNTTIPSNGTNSVFSSFTAIGGGYGGGQNQPATATINGNSGGSGGGGANSTLGTGTGGAGTSGQGNAGGSGSGGANWAGGGGGGASAAGANNPTVNTGGAGGAGTASSISGSSVTYAGGGGGGGGTTAGGAGGAGGGGSGAAFSAGVGGAGTANTGGGGGGARNDNGGAGGSGVVIISYPGSTQRMAGGTVTISGGNVIHTFTSSSYLTPITYSTNSLRFRSSASAYLNKTPSITGNRQKFTVSMWIKLGKTATQSGGRGALFGGGNCAPASSYGLGVHLAGSNEGSYIQLFAGGGTTLYMTSSNVFRDPSAWYHFVVAVDTTQSTASNRVRAYVNNQEITSWPNNTQVSQNASFDWNYAGTGMYLGAYNDGTPISTYFDGYMDEINLIDGQQLTPISFGSFNSYGVWQPITYGGSYGTNGAYFPFISNSSGYVANFSGSGQYLTVSSTAGINFGTNAFTVEGYICLSNVSSTKGVIFGVGNNSFGLRIGQSYLGNVNGLGIVRSGIADLEYCAYTFIVGVVYHIAVVRSGTTIYFFVNGVQQTTQGSGAGSYSYATPSTAYIGANNDTNEKFAGTISNLRVLNGTALYTSNFVPPTSTLTAITNTSLLTLQNATFVDNSTNAFTITNTGSTTTGLAYPFAYAVFADASPNNTTWTPTNFSLLNGTTLDSVTDVPTLTGATVANYATLNPIQTGSYATLSNASLRITGNTATNSAGSLATIGSSTGKWYYEAVVGSTGAAWVGVVTYWAGNPAYLIDENNVYGANSGTNKGIGIRGSGTTYGNAAEKQSISAFTFAVGDIVGVAIDADNGAVYFSVNGTYLNSGVPTSGASRTGSFTNWTPDSTRICFPALCAYNSNYADGNFGQQPFKYTLPSGYLALNTYNLATPTIPNGAVYMAATTYTGTGATQVVTNTVNGTAMQPDFVWLKSRSVARDHRLMDTNRGINNILYSDLTIAEAAGSALSSVNSNGFTLNTTDNQNVSSETYIGWQWKANAGTNVSNTSGTITSTVSANTTAGFAVVTYTGTNTAATVGHGLGVTPSMIIVKQRNSAVENWLTYHSSLTNPTTSYLYLNSTAAQATTAIYWNGGPTSSVFGIGAYSGINASAGTYVAYVFAAVAGYSAFGSYTGNGSTDGPFVFLGFRPRFVLLKQSNDVNSWFIWDSARNSYNVASATLKPNTADTQETLYSIDILSNGFKIRTSDVRQNTSGGTYIYAAFAENPFKYANAR